MTHTTNYNLNKFEAADRVTRDGFNQNADRIDAALKSVADAAAAAQSTANSAAASALNFVCGSYTGDGATSRVLGVGFTPRIVFICAASGHTVLNTELSTVHYGGLAVTGSSIAIYQGEILAIVPGGFTVHYNQVSPYLFISSNQANTVYNYLAIG